MPEGARQTVRFVVRGVVQGVGFRHFTVLKARALRLDGWVRNEADGSVVVTASGDAEALERFATLLESGPPAAQVSGVQRSAAEAMTPGEGFDVRR
ncbi:MAG: acylphosphatase [Acidobacteriota bacterium]